MNIRRKTVATIISALCILSVPAFAQMVTLEATGQYIFGDAPNESMEVAKERAREDAKRIAAEKAGVYIESYSKTDDREYF